MISVIALCAFVFVLFVAASCIVQNSAKVMHRCWDGTEAEVCTPSGVSQGDP